MPPVCCADREDTSTLAARFRACSIAVHDTRSALAAGGKALAAGAACIVLASTLMVWKSGPRDYASASLFDVIFLQILPHSSNVDATLRAWDWMIRTDTKSARNVYGRIPA